VAQREAPAAGYMLFTEARRLLVVDRSAEAWLRRLPDDGLGPFGVDVPVAIQSVVNCLWASAEPMVLSHVTDREGVNVTIRAERARFTEGDAGRTSGHFPANATMLCSVSLAATPWGAGHPAYRLLSARRREVALAVADGLGDEAIAARLGVSPATVHEHVQALHGVVGTKTRPALVATLNRGPR
jgi:DNA-binding CsgD family transcriptional regulator